MSDTKPSRPGKSLAGVWWGVGFVSIFFFVLAGPCRLAISSAKDARAADALWRYIIKEEGFPDDEKSPHVWLKPGAGGSDYWSRPPTVIVVGITEQQKQDSILATIGRYGDTSQFRTVKVQFVRNPKNAPRDILRGEMVALKQPPL